MSPASGGLVPIEVSYSQKLSNPLNTFPPPQFACLRLAETFSHVLDFVHYLHFTGNRLSCIFITSAALNQRLDIYSRPSEVIHNQGPHIHFQHSEVIYKQRLGIYLQPSETMHNRRASNEPVGVLLGQVSDMKDSSMNISWSSST